MCFVNDFDKQWIWATPFFFNLVSMKKFLSRINFEILILHFENKNCFIVSLKQFVFEILQLPVGFFFLKNGWFVLVLAILRLIKVHHEVTFYFIGFKARDSRFYLRKIVSFWTFILSTWIITSSLFTMSQLLWKSLLHFKSVDY